MMKVIIPKDIGFCPGVKHAVSIVERELAQDKKVYCYGEIVHNPDVIRELENKGLKIIGSLENVVRGDTVIIRAHGLPIKDYITLNLKEAMVVDATCRNVKKVQEYVKDSYFHGQQTVVIGKHGHPEVIGLAGQAPKVYVVDSIEEAQRLDGLKYLGVIIQTTYSMRKAEDILRVLQEKVSRCKIYDTMCEKTKNRQEVSKKMAAKVDAIIVVGGRNSSNTAELANCCREVQSKVYVVENESDLAKSMFDEVYKVGITGGLSTPYSSIENVARRIQELKPL